MKVLLVRHGIAEEVAAFAATQQHDDLRPLTIEGRRKFRRSAAGLAKVAGGIELIAHSPLVRSVETAHLLGKAFAGVPLQEQKLLGQSNKAGEWMKWLAGQKKVKSLAIVGHEPDLSRFIGLALVGRAKSIVQMKKGAACLVEFTEAVEPSSACLRWLLAPQQSRRI